MKIAINCIYYTPKGGGIKEYIYNLVTELGKIEHKHDIIFYITKESELDFRNIIGDSGILKIFPFCENEKIKRALFQQKYWTSEEEKEGFDVFHSPFFYAPNFVKAKKLLTVHDLRFVHYPRSYKLLRYLFLKYAVKKSIKNCDKIIAISDFTKKEILKTYNIDKEKVVVIHEAVNSGDFTLKNKSRQIVINNEVISSNKYLLAVGHLEPRKNYIRLIEAYLELPENIQKEYKLILVGKKNHDFGDILTKINQSDNVVYLDFVAREELIWLYANCKIHAFPSFYEGFGFSSLESGLFGKPTIGANQSSIPEIAGDGGVYFDPFSVKDISEKMLLLLSDQEKYEFLSRQSFLNTKRFSWARNAVETLNVYNNITQ